MTGAVTSKYPALHIVQIGWDTALLETRSASDAKTRQETYAHLLAEQRPGARMTVLVLGAPTEAKPYERGNLHVVPIPGRWTSLSRLHSTLGTLHRKAPISAIAAQSPFEEAWAALAFARRRIPVIAQVHFDLFSDAALPKGGALRSLAGRARRSLAKAALPRYAAVRVVAADMVERMRQLGVREVELVPVPVLDLDAFSAQRDACRPSPRVIFVGRLAPEKRLDIWLSAAKRILELVPSAHFDIVGDGAARPALMDTARALGLGANVMLHGGRTREELLPLFAQARVLLLTSDHEGFGRVLLEAMAAGVAVVTTRTAGALEVIGEGTNAGFLVPIGDTEALAAATARLLGDPELHSRTVSSAIARIEGRYVPLSLARHWVDMLVRAAERRPTAHPEGDRPWPAS